MNRGRWLNALIVGATLLVFLALAGAVVGGVAWGWAAADHGSSSSAAAATTDGYVPDVEPEPAPDPGASYRVAPIAGLPGVRYWVPGRGTTWCHYSDSYIDPADGWRVCPS